MRTTLTVDDDLFDQLRDLAHQRRISMREVLNEVLRRGLAVDPPPSTETFRVEVFRSPFCAQVDLQRLNQLVDDLAVDEALTKLSGGERRA